MTKILRVPDYLGHILRAIERIERYTADMDEAGFLNSELVQEVSLPPHGKDNVRACPIRRICRNTRRPANEFFLLLPMSCCRSSQVDRDTINVRIVSGSRPIMSGPSAGRSSQHPCQSVANSLHPQARPDRDVPAYP